MSDDCTADLYDCAYGGAVGNIPAYALGSSIITVTPQVTVTATPLPPVDPGFSLQGGAIVGSGFPDLQDEVGDPTSSPSVVRAPSPRGPTPFLPPSVFRGVPKVAPPPPIAAPGASPAPVSVPGPGLFPLGPIGPQFSPILAAVGFAVPLDAADRLLQQTLASMTDASGNPIFEGGLKPLFPPEPLPPAVGPPLPPPPVLETPGPVPTIDVPHTEVAPGQLSLFEEEQAAAAPALEDVSTLLGRVLGFASRVAGPLGLLFQTSEAGLPAAVESALVEAQLGLNPITGPITIPGPAGLPVSALEPFSDPGLSLTVSAPRVPLAVPADTPLGLGTFDVGVGSLPDIANLVNPTPAPAPRVRPRPAPSAGPSAPGKPFRFVNPLLGELPSFKGFPTPTPQLQSKPSLDPLNASSTCTCPKEPKKKQKQKKKQPRTICYRGTYIEHATGLTKHRKERIQCQSSSTQSRSRQRR